MKDSWPFHRIVRMGNLSAHPGGISMRKLIAVVVAGLAIGWIAAPSAAAPRARAPRSSGFGAPVKVTPDGSGGYEPAVYVDRFGNIFVTAHKENWQLALGRDDTSPPGTRSMSY